MLPPFLSQLTLFLHKFMCTNQKNVHMQYVPVVLGFPNTFYSNIETLNTADKRNHPYHPFGVDQSQALWTGLFTQVHIGMCVPVWPARNAQ